MNLIDGIRQEIAKEEINEFVFNKETYFRMIIKI